jgi:hypothetical protein
MDDHSPRPPGPKNKTLSEKQTKAKKYWGYDSNATLLSNKYKALCSNSSSMHTHKPSKDKKGWTGIKVMG